MEEETYNTVEGEEEEEYRNELLGDGYRSLATSEDESQLRTEPSEQFDEQNSRSDVEEVELSELPDHLPDDETEFLVQVEGASSTDMRKYEEYVSDEPGGKSEEGMAEEDHNHTLFEYSSEILGEYPIENEEADLIKVPSRQKSAVEVVDRMTIVKPKEQPCSRERMKNWLNRSRDEKPVELFLGGTYVARERNSDDPYPNVSRDKYSKEAATARRHEPKLRGRCYCPVKNSSKRKKKARKEEILLDSDADLPYDPTSIAQIGETQNRNICTCGSSSPKKDILQQSISKIKQTSKELKGSKKKPAAKICSCGKNKNSDRDGSKCDWYAKRIGKLSRWWFKQKSRACYCRRSRSESKKPQSRRRRRCICKRREGLRRKYKYLVKKAGNRRRDEEIAHRELALSAEKIGELLKAIGPKLAADFRRPPPKVKKPEVNKANSFVKKTMKEFGNMMRKNRLKRLNDGSVHSEPDKFDEDAFQYVEFPNGSSYYGQFTQLGMEGKCIYKMAHGPIFVGHMIEGMMEGNGRLIFPCGSFIDGLWIEGKLSDPKYTFNDGLKFQPLDWTYCRMPDRRFASEIMRGMKSPDNVQFCADHPARQIPKGCLDAEEGFYDPKKKVILHRSTGKIIRIIEEQEGNWILQNCRRRWFEEVPFSRYMYENWYPGTVFPPPGDEPDWFDIEFPKVKQSPDKIEDTLLSRKSAMEATSEALRRHEELLNEL